MAMYWKTPAGKRSVLYAEMLNQPHVLIAGATGSGKSVVINGMIHAALFNSPDTNKFVLIDPKKVNLLKFARLPHTMVHATTQDSICKALASVRALMDQRFSDMMKKGIEDFPGAHIYVFIDELMDICTSYPKQAQKDIQYLAQVGRAARVHVVAATQNIPIIPRTIRCNFDARLGLQTEDSQDSRNIIGCAGCEDLPKYGKGYYKYPQHLELNILPMIQPDAMQAVLNHWKKNRKPHFKFGRL